MTGSDNSDRPGGDEPKTVFMPGATGYSPSSAPTTSDWSSPSAPAPAPRLNPGCVQVGDILNHMFEVKRFIARGGMGEVYEGINISSDERVAIKLMLPALTADPNVQEMFRKEARTLTKLNHPALVQYRVLAQEPTLGLLYIVTEYIDGSNLSDVLGTLRPSPAELRGLAIRLADGLREAHSLGAIHRDVSPDNVLLEGGRLDRAKIIDFGIAKDLDPGSKTIVGEGFAGKLNYVAPEQLGAHGREVGPWSDVYSLGLVLLAVAEGRDVDMGATLFDAVERRRSGPNLSAAPDELRPVLEQMLRDNPADRLRSMQDVITALNAPGPLAARTAGAIASGSTPASAVQQPKRTGESASNKKPIFIAGGIATAVLVLAGSYLAFSGSEQDQVTSAPIEAPVDVPPIRQTATQDPRSVVEDILSAVRCSWLNVNELSSSPEGLSLIVRGVTDSPGRVQGEIAKELSKRGFQAAEINSEAVATVPQSMCGALEAFRPMRVEEPERLISYQPEFEMKAQDDGGVYAEALLRADIGAPPEEVAFLGLEDDGTISELATSRAEFEGLAEEQGWRKEGPNTWRPVITANKLGWTGVLMIRGKGRLDKNLMTTPEAQRSTQWAKDFAEAAKRGDWKGEMIWFRIKDDQPN